MAQHPQIRGVKDAKGDLWAATHVMDRTDLQWFSGADELNLAHLAHGATGIVSVVGHVAGRRYAQMIAAIDAGDLDAASRAFIEYLDHGWTSCVGAATAKPRLDVVIRNAIDAGDLSSAQRIHRELIPILDALMTTSQGAIMAKAALVELGVIEHATVRLPYVESPPEHLDILRKALAVTDLA